jgi:hypothetical protein
LAVALLLAALFFLGETDSGQVYLRGKPANPSDHFVVDDQYMGAALAPFIYCLVPASLLFLHVCVSVIGTKFRSAKRNTAAQSVVE